MDRALLDSQPWEALLKMLTVYAHQLLKRHYWRGEVGGVAPGGKEAADFALEAIEDLYNGARQWDQEKHPDLAMHLRSIVKSKIGNAVRGAENRLGIRSDTATEGRHIDDDAVFIWGFLQELRDEPILQEVVLCIARGVSGRSEIARFMGLSAEEVTNIRKRLARRLTAYRHEITNPSNLSVRRENAASES